MIGMCIDMYERTEHKKIYEGSRISLYRDSYVMPDGHTASKDIVEHGGSAAMIAIDDDGKILLVRQYRHTARRETLELPAGTMEKGEQPISCAIREIEEETGCKAARIKPLFNMYTAIGFCTEIIYIFLCEGLTKTAQNLDEDECIDVESYTLDEITEMIMQGSICDGKTISAILYYKNSLDEQD